MQPEVFMAWQFFTVRNLTWAQITVSPPTIFSFHAQFLKRSNLAQAHSTGANEQHYLEIAQTALI